MPSPNNLEDIISAARELESAFQAGDADAIDRVHQHLPQVKYGTRDEAAAFPLGLDEARTVIARENGAQSWGELRLRIKLQGNDFGCALDEFKQLVYAKDADKLDELPGGASGFEGDARRSAFLLWLDSAHHRQRAYRCRRRLAQT